MLTFISTDELLLHHLECIQILIDKSMYWFLLSVLTYSIPLKSLFIYISQPLSESVISIIGILNQIIGLKIELSLQYIQQFNCPLIP